MFEPQKDSLFFSNHEGFHDGFHEPRSSWWGPWTPPQSDNSETNGAPLAPVAQREPHLGAWLRVNRGSLA
jgi:hypothetical protein